MKFLQRGAMNSHDIKQKPSQGSKRFPYALQRWSFMPEIDGEKKYSPPRGIMNRLIPTVFVFSFGGGNIGSGRFTRGAGLLYIVTSSSSRRCGGTWPMIGSIPCGRPPHSSDLSSGPSALFAHSEMIVSISTATFTNT